MDFFFSKIHNFIFSFLVICFILIVAGSDVHYPNNNKSKSVVPSPRQRECFKNIQELFKINMEKRKERREYADYAVRFIRNLTDDQRAEYSANFPPGENTYSPYLLYEGEFNTIFDNRYVFEYYSYLKEKLVRDNILTPGEYCPTQRNKANACMPTSYEVIEFAFTKRVLSDFQNENSFPVLYMKYIAKFIRTIKLRTWWPEDFCIRKFK